MAPTFRQILDEQMVGAERQLTEKFPESGLWKALPEDFMTPDNQTYAKELVGEDPTALHVAGQERVADMLKVVALAGGKEEVPAAYEVAERFAGILGISDEEISAYSTQAEEAVARSQNIFRAQMQSFSPPFP